MIFEKLPTVLTAEELIDKAFKKASRTGGGKAVRVKATESMILTASNIISDNLLNNVRRFPNFDDIPQFYRELTDILVGIDQLKMSLSSLHWASTKVKTLSRSYIGNLRKGQNPAAIRKQAFGRIASVVREIDSDLKFLNEARGKLRKLPAVADIPTIIVAGYPNVGKSSFVAWISSAKPQISTYPFTTKGVLVGHFTHDGIGYQVIDTPGLLDRPLSERNRIELQAISALKHLGDVVLFILDPSETCGYLLDAQKRLLVDIEKELKIPIVVVTNKGDLRGVDADMSTKTGEGVAEIKAQLIEILKRPRARASSHTS
ncbi:MAG: NOG1 family protein [Methanosarcinales archaeon Met12]|nr:MAG: NOG1 family protein [Methanosarcinales archaeon Met12]